MRQTSKQPQADHYPALQAKADEERARHRIAGVEIGRICSTDGYAYLKAIARDYLAAYACPPPMTDAEKTKWDSYNLLKAGIEHLFREAESLAAKSQTPIVEEIKSNGNSRRKRKQ